MSWRRLFTAGRWMRGAARRRARGGGAWGSARAGGEKRRVPKSAASHPGFVAAPLQYGAGSNRGCCAHIHALLNKHLQRNSDFVLRSATFRMRFA
jgi:hypothetical protein